MHAPEAPKMIRTLLAHHARDLAAVLLVATVTGLSGPAFAGSRAQEPAVEQNTMSGPPVMAVVSVKDQRISVYDAHGGAMRSRISSGRTDYETPVGIYSVLEKNRDHYSNVYDAAAMPFMQRITWSGVALHQGELPGYPASHGCVRLPYSYAEQIFPITKVGMRVIITRDSIAPVEMTHPALLQPAPIVEHTAAMPIAYETQERTGSVFQADVRNWPERQAEMDALKAIASSKATDAELTKGPVEDIKTLQASKIKERGAVAKLLKATEKSKKIADDKAARADRELAAAKDPAKIKRPETEKTKADAYVIKTAEALTTAKTNVLAATTDRERRRTERAERVAERVNQKAINDAARTARELTAAQSPLRYKKQEEALAKAAEAAAAAGKKHTEAAAVVQAANAGLAKIAQDLAAAVARMDAAVAAASEAERKTYPVSMFVSLKTQRVYLRQGHQPIADMPVTIADPGKPIGTHVFTAVDYEKGANAVRWTAVSLARRPLDSLPQLSSKAERRSDFAPEPYPTNVAVASAALDRVTLPPEMLARVSQSVWPGSSLIVSDEDVSKETGNSTDFVVLISGEPQGGIKRRPKPKPAPIYYYNGYNGYSAYSSGGYYSWNSNPNYYKPNTPPRYYDRYGRPVRIQKKPVSNWW